MNHAEKLASRRKPDIFPNSTFDYFDASNVTETLFNNVTDKDLDNYLREVTFIFIY